jgi:hypothetical protein
MLVLLEKRKRKTDNNNIILVLLEKRKRKTERRKKIF